MRQGNDERRSEMGAGLDGLKVVEVGEGAATAMAGKLLADLGATVVKVEPPGGDPARRRGPFRDGKADPEASGTFIALNTGKRGVTLELGGEAGQAALHRLAARAHLLVHDVAPPAMAAAGLDYATLSRENPRLVMVSITPFGLDGPYRDYAADDLTLIHGSGFGWFLTGCPADPALPPNKPYGRHALMQGGMHGAMLGLAACHGAATTGVGEHVDCSILEAMVNMMGRHLTLYSVAGRLELRLANKLSAPNSYFSCRDGDIFIICPEQDQWERLLEAMGDPAWAEPREDFGNRDLRAERCVQINREVLAWTQDWELEALFHDLQARRVPCAPVYTYDRIAAQEHLRARDFFHDHDQPAAGRIALTGAPYRLREKWWRLRGPAPSLGEANGELDTLLAGAKSEKIADDGTADAVTGAPRVSVAGYANGSAAPTPNGAPPLPLAGVRVLDLAWVWAGPHCTELLGFLGAEVNKVESSRRIDLARRLPPFTPGLPEGPNSSAYFNNIGQGKRSLAINLGSPEGIALVRRLAGESDVVVSNFGYGVMERLGLGSEALLAENPNLIMARISAFGQEGPLKHYTGYGPAMLPLSGLVKLTGYEIAGVQDVGIAYADPNAGTYAALAIAAALWARGSHGGGQEIDVSLWEAMVTTCVDGWMAHAMGLPTPAPMANHDPEHAPHQVFRCAGDDEWVSVAVTRDAQWRALCRVIDEPALGEDARFATAPARKAHEAEVDALLAGWCATRDRWEVTRLLQAEGVAAFPSLHSKDLAEDPHLWARGFLRRPDHPVMGEQTLAAVPWRLARRPNDVLARAPLLGEHTEQVLGEVLGLSAAEVARLREQGALE